MYYYFSTHTSLGSLRHPKQRGSEAQNTKDNGKGNGGASIHIIYSYS